MAKSEKCTTLERKNKKGYFVLLLNIYILVRENVIKIPNLKKKVK